MASNLIPKLSHLSLLVLVFVSTTTFFPPRATSVHCPRESVKWTYFITEILKGPDSTVVPAAGGQNRSSWNPRTWGTILVADNPLAVYPGPNSTLVGRVRGLVAASSRDGRYSYISATVMFTNKAYNGSTLQLKGLWDRPARQPSELPIVGGTKKLRGVRGYVMLRTYSLQDLEIVFKLLLNTSKNRLCY